MMSTQMMWDELVPSRQIIFKIYYQKPTNTSPGHLKSPYFMVLKHIWLIDIIIPELGQNVSEIVITQIMKCQRTQVWHP